MQAELDKLAGMVREARRIVVFSGAGISTESGIPDFRGPQGIWTKVDPREYYIDRFMASETSRRAYWQRATTMYREILAAEPNRGHRAVATLERMGKLGTVITQNVDGLHQRAGNSPEKVIELHGSTLYVSCLSCGARHTREAFQPRVSEDGEAPPCDQCGGLMKPATISFGQQLEPETLERAAEETALCDLFIVVGSSLQVYPAAGYPLQAVSNGVPLVIVNHQETPHDGYAELVLNASSGEVLGPVVDALAADMTPEQVAVPN